MRERIRIRMSMKMGSRMRMIGMMRIRIIMRMVRFMMRMREMRRRRLGSLEDVKCIHFDKRPANPIFGYFSWVNLQNVINTL